LRRWLLQKKLENGEGAAATLGEERRGKRGGRVTAKRGKGGGCPQGALREGAARVLGGGGEVGFPPPDRVQRPKTIPTPELSTPAHTTNINFTVLQMFTS
jgi:hypothetical protein